jgi:hypothetical protein
MEIILLILGRLTTKISRQFILDDFKPSKKMGREFGFWTVWAKPSRICYFFIIIIIILIFFFLAVIASMFCRKSAPVLQEIHWRIGLLRFFLGLTGHWSPPGSTGNQRKIRSLGTYPSCQKILHKSNPKISQSVNHHNSNPKIITICESSHGIPFSKPRLSAVNHHNPNPKQTQNVNQA